jgi:hypothetical protein
MVRALASIVITAAKAAARCTDTPDKKFENFSRGFSRSSVYALDRIDGARRL